MNWTRQMTQAEEPFEDPFASLLAQYESELTAGAPVDPSRFSSLADPRLAGRLVKAGECLELLEQVWPRPHGLAPDGEPLPEAVDRFEIIRELGRGGFGIVYLALDPVLRREIALKLQRPETVLSPELRRRFLREAQAAGALNHPNIVAVYEVGEASVLAWIAVEHCPGMSLAQWLARWQTPVPPRLAAELAAQLADAVAYAHGRGILHRDIKPSNVLLVAEEPSPSGRGQGEGARVARPEEAWETAKEQQDTSAVQENGAASSPELVRDAGAAVSRTPFTGHQGVPPACAMSECFDGGGAPCPPEAGVLAREAVAFLSRARPKLTDFGLAKVLDGDAVETKSGTMIGTPGYMAPEQIESAAGTVGQATDVYGLGLVLYEMLTAKPAFSGTTRAETLKRVLLEEPATPRKLCRQVPRDLQAIVMEAIDKKPERRYFSAAELAIDLRRYLADKPVRARQPRFYEHAWRFVRRRPAWVTTAALLILAGCLLAGLTRIASENRALLGYQMVRFTTNPDKARVVFVPLNPATGEPDPTKAVRPSGRTPVRVELLPADYFVVVKLDDGRFHEVYRHVPRGRSELAFAHEWDIKSGEFEIPLVDMPRPNVADGMAPISLDTEEPVADTTPAPSFYMDCREFSIGDFLMLEPRAPIDDIDGKLNKDLPRDHAMLCGYDLARRLAEKCGKRLPTFDEYRLVAKHRISESRAISDRSDAVTEFGPVGTPAEDRTDTDPPIFGLYSNVAEWTVTPVVGAMAKPGFDGRLIFGGDQFVVGGNPTVAREHREAAAPFAVHQAATGIGLGFRCVRSVKPHYIDDATAQVP
jgi:serine/threonine-protein kinase